MEDTPRPIPFFLPEGMTDEPKAGHDESVRLHAEGSDVPVYPLTNTVLIEVKNSMAARPCSRE